MKSKWTQRYFYLIFIHNLSSSWLLSSGGYCDFIHYNSPFCQDYWKTTVILDLMDSKDNIQWNELYNSTRLVPPGRESQPSPMHTIQFKADHNETQPQKKSFLCIWELTHGSIKSISSLVSGHSHFSDMFNLLNQLIIFFPLTWFSRGDGSLDLAHIIQTCSVSAWNELLFILETLFNKLGLVYELSKFSFVCNSYITDAFSKTLSKKSSQHDCFLLAITRFCGFSYLLPIEN